MNKTLVSISTAVTAAALCIAVPAASAAPLNNAQSIPADLSSHTQGARKAQGSQQSTAIRNICA